MHPINPNPSNPIVPENIHSKLSNKTTLTFLTTIYKQPETFTANQSLKKHAIKALDQSKTELEKNEISFFTKIIQKIVNYISHLGFFTNLEVIQKSLEILNPKISTPHTQLSNVAVSRAERIQQIEKLKSLPPLEIENIASLELTYEECKTILKNPSLNSAVKNQIEHIKKLREETTIQDLIEKIDTPNGIENKDIDSLDTPLKEELQKALNALEENKVLSFIKKNPDNSLTSFLTNTAKRIFQSKLNQLIDPNHVYIFFNNAHTEGYDIFIKIWKHDEKYAKTIIEPLSIEQKEQINLLEKFAKENSLSDGIKATLAYHQTLITERKFDQANAVAKLTAKQVDQLTENSWERLKPILNSSSIKFKQTFNQASSISTHKRQLTLSNTEKAKDTANKALSSVKEIFKRKPPSSK